MSTRRLGLIAGNPFLRKMGLRSMPNSPGYLDYVLEQLGGLGGVSAHPMFGGVGLYRQSRIFGIVFGDTLYFKVNEATRADYESRGLARFRPYPGRPAAVMGYYEVPAEVIEDGEECTAWGRKAADGAAALSARRPSPQRRNRRPR